MIMEFLERDLEDIIIENKHHIHERGLCKLYSNVVRQFALPNRTIVDLFSWEVVDNVCYCQVFELKRNVINRDAYFQIIEYHKELLRILCSSDFASFKIDLILIGKNSCDEIWYSCFLGDNLKMYSYSYNYDGIRFTKDSFSYSECLADKSVDSRKEEYSTYYDILKKGVD